MKTTRKYKPWAPGAWARTLPEDYFKEMGQLVDKVTLGWFSERDIEEGFADYVKARYIFGRMEICHERIMPWLQQAAPQLGNVLEIGCGNGSATVCLSSAAAHVYAFDLSTEQAEIAARRCDIMGCSNVTTFAKPASWIDDYYNDPSSLAPQIDTIICYAVFEHLLPLERIKLLIGAWRHLKIGGRLVIIETPNRLYFFDWHSYQIPFQDQLPVEIAFLWSAFSERNNVPPGTRAMTVEEATKGNIDALYRFGRGASFHEFYAALGPDNFKVVNEVMLDRKADISKWDQEFIDVLLKQFRAVKPPPHAGFAQPCLDLILKKTGESRMQK